MKLKQSNHNIFTLPISMRTCLDRLLALPHVSAPLLKNEANYVAKRLEICLYEDIISNDAFLAILERAKPSVPVRWVKEQTH